MSPRRHMPGPLVQSLRPTGQLKSRPCAVLCVAYSEILEGELSLSVVERTTATKARQLFVERRRRFYADNPVFRVAGLALEYKGRGV